MQAAAGGSLAKEFLKLCDVVPPMSYSDCFHKLVCDCLSPSLSVSALSSTLMDPFVSPPIKIALVYLSLPFLSQLSSLGGMCWALYRVKLLLRFQNMLRCEKLTI